MVRLHRLPDIPGQAAYGVKYIHKALLIKTNDNNPTAVMSSHSRCQLTAHGILSTHHVTCTMHSQEGSAACKTAFESISSATSQGIHVVTVP